MKNIPAFKTFILVCSGTAAGYLINLSYLFTFFLFALSLLLSLLLFFKKSKPLLFQICLTVSLILFGLASFKTYDYVSRLNPAFKILKPGEFYKIRAHLLNDPKNKNTGLEYTAAVDQIFSRNRKISVKFKLLVKDYQKISENLKYGDEVIFSGVIKIPGELRNPGGFNYKKYLSQKNIYYLFSLKEIIQVSDKKKGDLILRKFIYPVRRSMIKKLFLIIPQKTTRSMITALILGDRSLIEPDIIESFAKTGIIHVLAVSGLHVGFLLLILTAILNLCRLNRYILICLTITGLIFFALLTESHPPVVRAVIMASLYLLAKLFERKTDPFNIIGTAGLIIIIYNPKSLFSLGFILSFAAISSIIYFYQKFTSLKFYTNIKKKNFLTVTILPLLLISLSALIGTIPLTAFYFNRIPLLSLFINLFAVPLTGLIVALSFTSLFFSLISLKAASVYGALIHLLVTIFSKSITWLSSIKFSYINVSTPDILFLITYYIFMFLLFNYKNIQLRKILIFLLLIFMNTQIWIKVISRDYIKLKWTQFDVGQGDSALIEMPRKKIILIDGGNKSSFFDNGKRIISQYLRTRGITKIDAVILTHPHNDHVGGLEYLIKNYNTGCVYYTDPPFETKSYNEFLKIAAEKNIPLVNITAPDSLSLPVGRLYFISPNSTIKSLTSDSNYNLNNQSIVALLLYGKTTVLFMGDAEKRVEEELLHQYKNLRCDVIKAGHHGSSTSSTFPFLRRVRPDISIISVGRNNRYHLPSSLVLGYYQLLNTSTHRTDKEGAAVLKSDGKKIFRVDWR